MADPLFDNMTLDGADTTATLEDSVMSSLRQCLGEANAYSGRIFGWIAFYAVIEPGDAFGVPKVTVRHLFKGGNDYYYMHEMPKLSNNKTNAVIFTPGGEPEAKLIRDTRERLEHMAAHLASSGRMVPREVWAQVASGAGGEIDYTLSYGPAVSAPSADEAIAAWRTRMEAGVKTDFEEWLKPLPVPGTRSTAV